MTAFFQMWRCVQVWSQFWEGKVQLAGFQLNIQVFPFNEASMSRYATILLFLTGLSVLTACATAATQPTATALPAVPATVLPGPSATVEPLATDTAAASSASAGATATLDIFSELNPASAPLKSWNNVPVMPGAIAGDGNAASYFFTTKATQDAIKAFYDTELAKQGYAPLAVGNGENGAVVLFYQSASTNAMFDISLFTKDGTILVMFVK